LDAGAEIHAHDPEGMEEAAKLMPGVHMQNGPYEAADQADAVAIVTEWDAYRALDLNRLKSTMRGHILADLRNVYEPQTATAAGFEYVSIGR
jgi:UDPglucose 6-dehydrogenase